MMHFTLVSLMDKESYSNNNRGSKDFEYNINLLLKIVTLIYKIIIKGE